MFLNFLDHYSPTDTFTDLQPDDGESLFQPAYRQVEGTTFEHGLYRIHTTSTGRAADDHISTAFPAHAGSVRCFGFDWMGRQFAADLTRMVDGQPEVVMFEPGTGEVFDIPGGFGHFHDQTLVEPELAEAALAVSFFQEWRGRHQAPLRFDQCVGYRIPLFLSGADTLDNLELTDLDVYWTLTAQLIVATRDLAPRTRLGEITTDNY